MARAAQSTYLPDDPVQVAAVYDFMAAHTRRGGEPPVERYRLIGSGPGDEVDIPEHVYRILRDVIEAMHHNLAITLVPQTTTLTTQQAADLLGVSRPTLVKYLEQGRLPFQKVGSHRRVMLADLMAFQEERKQAQRRFLAEADLGEDVDVEEMRSRVKRVRRQLAETAADPRP